MSVAKYYYGVVRLRFCQCRIVALLNRRSIGRLNQTLLIKDLPSPQWTGLKSNRTASPIRVLMTIQELAYCGIPCQRKMMLFTSRNLIRLRIVSKRCMATAVDTPADKMMATAKGPANSISEVEPSKHVASLVESIAKLNLVETAQLVTMLKKKLNLPDVVAAAPIVMGNFQTNAPSGSATPAAPVAPAKTEFNITLEKFDPTNKAKVIKEIKALLPNLNLVEAKAFVESAPKLVKEKVKKEDAEKIKKTLESVGATILLD